MTMPSAQLTLGSKQRAAVSGEWPLLERGFRPFFLLAAAFAAVGVPLWLLALSGGLQPGGTFGAMQWHAHEMLFGYTLAVLAGFLLTAVTNWTGRRTATGPVLGVLSLVWLLGRVAMFWAGAAPRLAAVVDAAFLPLLAVTCALPILATQNRRNYVFLAILTLLSGLNAAVQRAALHSDFALVRDLHALALDVIVLVMVIVTGRIVPSFTHNATGRGSSSAQPTLERWSALAVLAVLATDALRAARVAEAVLTPTAIAFSALAALLLTVRMHRWGAWHTRREPLLWILHVGSAWLPVGFALRAASLLSSRVPAGSALHALTAGAIGCLTLGMMARVSLGHTGRMLRAPRSAHLAFIAVVSAGALRVLAPWFSGELYLPALELAGVAWSSAFVLFLGGYARVLVTPRVDGR